MLVLGLKRLQKNANNFNYNSVKLSSCMTLLTEKIYSAVNKKQATQTLVTYAQTFATAIKESIKSVPKLSVHYFTSRERCARISVTTKRLDISKMKVQAFWLGKSNTGVGISQRCSCTPTKLSIRNNYGKNRNALGKCLFWRAHISVITERQLWWKRWRRNHWQKRRAERWNSWIREQGWCWCKFWWGSCY